MGAQGTMPHDGMQETGGRWAGSGGRGPEEKGPSQPEGSSVCVGKIVLSPGGEMVRPA